jgi:plasmid stabilization system protein ParE
MMALADDILDARGRLVRELREHYKRQLRAYPEIGRMMIGLGREREIPFDRLIPEPRGT